jgi:uncharacterized protein YyaL (SSP411 family)
MSENRLGQETSPYLLQHQDNPVHWWAWGPEALAEAKRTGKPIMLSVGYAACHWCHVMAHESFEDDATAAVMNDLFVNIKVDREERPDIDAIYMGALHRLGQQGGWPLTMFLDSDARPFWGGTYFPKQSAWGRPAFVEVLERIADVYKREPDKVATNADALMAALAERPSLEGTVTITDPMLKDITQRMVRAVDPDHGGISGAPKFPQWSFFWLLWRGGIRYGHEPAKAAVIKTLEQICQGGIYDHLGGGFARYSVDELWLVPHFEKMLYDNALLIDLMTEVWRETHDHLLATRIAETITWLEREMIADGGAFTSSLDADSEGEEGKFYVWTADEILKVLGADDAELFGKVYGVTPEGNFEDHTILNRLGSVKLLAPDEEKKLASLRAKLLAARSSRIRPGWDDKVLADWNGLMIAALVKAAKALDHPEWLSLATRSFTFIVSKMTVDSRLVHSSRQGRGHVPAVAGDYANMIRAALHLYEASNDPEYLTQARAWTKIMDEHYWMDERGGYATAADDTRDVIIRLKTASDDATPSANAIMVSNLSALALLTDDQSYAERATEIITAFSDGLAKNLLAHTGLLAAAMDVLSPQLVVIAGAVDGNSADLEKTRIQLSLPGALEFSVSGEASSIGPPALVGKGPVEGRAAAYICIGPQCQAPETTSDGLLAALRAARSAA